MGISAMNGAVKNNRNLKNRRTVYEAFKKIKGKIKFHKKEENSFIKEMNENDIILLRDQLETEAKFKLVAYVFLITSLTIGILYFLNSYFNSL